MSRVTFVLSQHGGLVGGGLENQAEATMAALEARGWEVHVHHPLDKSLGDIVHFFGTFDAYWDLARQCQVRNVPFVCSPVFLPPVTGTPLRMRALRKRFTDRTIYRGQRKLYTNAERLFTLSRQEQKNLRTYYGEGLAPFVSVPNGVSETFATATADLFRSQHGYDRPLVICTGRLAERKNQLTLIQAVEGLNVDLVLYGAMDDLSYVDQCRAAAGANVHFLGVVPPGDPMLASAYAAATVFCQPSRAEVLSLSALEAACSGTQLVLSDAWGAEEFFGRDATYCPVNNVGRWRVAIEAAVGMRRDEPTDDLISSATHLRRDEPTDALISDGQREARRKRYAATYSWPSVAAQIEAQYREVLA